MASIKKINARKLLEGPATPFAGVSNRDDSGLTFEIHIGLYRVFLTHVERDMVIENWKKAERDWEKG